MPACFAGNAQPFLTTEERSTSDMLYVVQGETLEELKSDLGGSSRCEADRGRRVGCSEVSDISDGSRCSRWFYQRQGQLFNTMWVRPVTLQGMEGLYNLLPDKRTTSRKKLVGTSAAANANSILTMAYT
jgi:hypothetical protein